MDGKCVSRGTGMHRPVQKSMCFSIFFCGCKLLKSFHIQISAAKISLFRETRIRASRINIHKGAIKCLPVLIMNTHHKIFRKTSFPSYCPATCFQKRTKSGYVPAG